jgi:predicted nucleic acid-binding protein
VIALDTSSIIAFLGGADGADVEIVDAALSDKTAVLPPVVLAETLSDPKLGADVAEWLAMLPLLDLAGGYWRRAGVLRARVLARRRKARLADALIAQSCLDHGVPLVTRDRDFRHFASATGMRLLP